MRRYGFYVRELKVFPLRNTFYLKWNFQPFRLVSEEEKPSLAETGSKELH